jgi:hypothetical protein
MAPLGAVWENDFFPLPETDFLHFISPHRPNGSKMLTFFWWTANAIDTDLPFKWGEIVLQALGSNSEVGAKLQPLLVPQTLT